MSFYIASIFLLHGLFLGLIVCGSIHALFFFLTKEKNGFIAELVLIITGLIGIALLPTCY